MIPKDIQNSSFIWVTPPPGRNQFVSFQQTVEWRDQEKLHLQLFADTRFRLYVNGRFLSYGPARFVTQYAEYDSYDLTSAMQQGRNQIRVEVNFYGTSSYQSMPDGKPGFIAAGGSDDGTIDLATPGYWSAKIHHAWNHDAPLFSFAQNPCEILDTQILASELRSPYTDSIRVLTEAETPWTTLRARSAPYPDYHPVSPECLLVTAPIDDSFQRIGCHSIDRGVQQKKQNKRQTKSFQVATWIHSTIDQQTVLETFWSEIELNGQPVKLDDSSLQGNHGLLHVKLQKGWNFYTASVEQLTECWSYLLGWPRAAGLSLHARPDLSDSFPWSLSPLQDNAVELTLPEEVEHYEIPTDWYPDSGDLSRVTPARQVAWEIPSTSEAVRNLTWGNHQEAVTQHAASAVWSLDFGDQFYGHPLLEVEGPEGTVLDLAYDDWPRDDGCVNLYHSNPFTDASDRFFLAGGRQCIDVLNPRGGRYLQVTLRSPDGRPAGLTLHDLSVHSRQVLRNTPLSADFQSDNPVVDWMWKTSIQTLTASTDEAYADCPWRERGSYIGDALVNLHLHRLISHDLSIARRTFRMMGEGQHMDGPRKGQLASVTPAWHRQGHEDFTLIWILCLRDYGALSGDISLAEEMWPVVERIWESSVWVENENGLWDVTSSMNLFIDWGVNMSDRDGKSNLILNLFRLGALQASAEIAHHLDKKYIRFQEEAEQVANAIQQQLWNEQAGRFDASNDDQNSACLHGQVLALLFKVGDAQCILKTIAPLLQKNLSQGLKHGQHSGHLELYFQVYLLQALEKVEAHDLAIAFIKDHAGFLNSLDHPTLPEGFCRAQEGEGSCCHSWSGYSAVYATRNILGLRQAEPGNMSQWILDPKFQEIYEASGSVPHPEGTIEVHWKRSSGCIQAEIRAPKNVEVVLIEGT